MFAFLCSILSASLVLTSILLLCKNLASEDDRLLSEIQQHALGEFVAIVDKTVLFAEYIYSANYAAQTDRKW